MSSVRRVAVLSDVHGNLPALRAVVDDIRRCAPDLVVSCGDLASGPLPVETIEYLRGLDLPLRSVRGNADRGAVESFDGVAGAGTHADDRWTGAQLDRGHRDFLAGLPPTLTLEVAGLGTVLFCHGSPRSDEEIVLETMPADQLDAVLAGVEADVVVCGNTHMQFDRRAGDRRVVNAGSVGWPYGRPGAYWALLGPAVDLRRTGYDVAAAADELRRRSRWPGVDRFAAMLARPPARAEALAFFARMATWTEDDEGGRPPP